MNKITLGDRQVPYTLRESKRARRINLKIDWDGLEVVVPVGFPLNELDDILRQRERWILKHLAVMDELPPPRQYVSGEQVLYLGQAHTLQVNVGSTKSRVTVKHQHETVRINMPAGLSDTEHIAAVKTALESWYRRAAKQYIPQRVEEIAVQHGFRYQNITIRGQKTRWGSCSTLGNLNFNWRLMMTPPEAIDYLIVHELAHLKEMNHSSRFWAVVADICPDYAYWRRWLRDNTALLRL